jgi:hypothetical protein
MKQPGLKSVMRRAAVTTICCLGFAGIATSQSTGTVAMPSQNATLKAALEQIRRQTGYMIVVNFDNVDATRAVDLPAERLSVNELLNRVLEDTGFTHVVVGRRLLIVPEPPIDEGEGAISALWHPGRDAVGEGLDTWGALNAGGAVVAKGSGEGRATVSKAHSGAWPGNRDKPTATEVLTFRTGSEQPEADFMDNSRAISHLDTSLSDTAVVARLDHISVTAASSPDAGAIAGRRLAARRAEHTKGYLVGRYPHLAPERVHTFSVGEEWSGLRRLVEQDARVPDRDEVLAVMDATTDDRLRDTLQRLGHGRSWRYIRSRLMPRLRGATAVTLHFEEIERSPDTVRISEISGGATKVALSEFSGVREAGAIDRRVVSPEAERPLLALKTNLWMDAATIFNIGIEVPLGSGWSVGGEAILPWWIMSGGTIEGRRWLGNRSSHAPLTGWFTGIHVGGGHYDIFSREGDYHYVGVGVGYAGAVSRNGRLRMEYSFGAGYIGGDRFNTFSPTRASVGLVFMINR